jgi:molecular chaperone HtpG
MVANEYVDRMKEGHNNIYYFSCGSIAAVSSVSSSPFIEEPKKIGIEGIYVGDPIDGYSVWQLQELDGRKMKSVTIRASSQERASPLALFSIHRDTEEERQ